ncbi:hypothetical protein FRC09_000175 [Ceratobasidium sp. 395]|nr:hypothetical protein FRC09_000175 [Ceratobasidium sp. 395]
MPNTAAVAQPRHSIMLAKLEVLRLSNAEGVSGLNLLFRTLDMPQLLHLFLRTCSARPWTRLDWGAICYSRALRSLELEGFSSEALTGLLMHIELLSQLEAFRLLWSWLATPSEFAGQFACKLLETSYCPSLLSFNISFTLKDEHMETVKELRRARSSLCIFVRSDDSGYDDDDTAEEDELLGVENEGHVGNDSH